MNMSITLAPSAGFCFGVNRAVDLVEQLLNEGKSVCTLGPIIHNPQVVENFEKRGVTIVRSPDEVPDDSVLVIRSHGVPPEIYEQVEKKGCACADATCVFVDKIHKIVAEQSTTGRTLIIAGDPVHPEVVGIRGYCKGPSFVVSTAEDLDRLLQNDDFSADTPIFLVAQTTFNRSIWEKCVIFAKRLCTNALIFDTICNATAKRQKEAVDLSQKCDIMVIVGGRESSNTAKLRDVCEPHCRTVLIETADELRKEWFDGVRSVGVTAGASTPADIIKEVLSTMSEIVNNEIETTAAQAAPEASTEVAPQKSFEEMTFEEALEASLQSMNANDRVRGIVVAIAPNEVQVEVIGRKQAGYIPANELSADPNAVPSEVVKVGDELELLIMRTNDQEGTIMLSKKRVDALKGWDTVVSAKESGEVLDGVVSDVIKGGVLAVTNGVRVFIPASHASATRMADLSSLRHQNVRFKIIEVNEQRRRAVGSIRVIAQEERRELAEKFWAQAEVGQKYTGTVKSLTSYSAFVDIGGVDGMIHISELSWTRIKHPSEVVNVGDVVEVYIRDLDPEKRKISLGYRKAEDNPIEIFKAKYAEGDVVTAKIVGMTTFGAFAQILPSVDGLIHISQIANHRVEKPQDELKIGQEVEAKITKIDLENNRISLSMRALLPAEEAPVAEETAEEAAE